MKQIPEHVSVNTFLPVGLVKYNYSVVRNKLLIMCNYTY